MSNVYELDNQWFPITIAYVPDNQAWNEVMKGIDCHDEYSDDFAHTAYYKRECGKDSLILVTMSDRTDDMDDISIQSFLTHEAVHVMQFVCLHIGESDPGAEFQAYCVQRVSEQLMRAWKDYHGKKAKEGSRSD